MLVNMTHNITTRDITTQGWLQKSAYILALGMVLTPFSSASAKTTQVASLEMPQSFTGIPVTKQMITDCKTVFATAQSSDENQARSRMSGTVTSLNVDEGTLVKRGQLIGKIVDKKLQLKLNSVDAQIRASKALLGKSRNDLTRGQKLKSRGVVTSAKIDALSTAFNVNKDTLKSAQAERSVLVEQIKQGDVLAPSDGRVLKVSVTKGSVVMPGETLVSIAANKFILRMQLPERHARFIKLGDKVVVGARGLDPDEKSVGEGTISQIYPELKNGYLIADIKIDYAGNYFVGERTLVRIAAEKRKTIIIPKGYSFKRNGLDYVKLEREGKQAMNVIVQLGSSVLAGKNHNNVEVLSGLHVGDHILKP